MYRHDYIMRIIERFGQALVALRNRILRREADQAAVASEIRLVAQAAGLDLDIARRLDPASLLIWLAPTGQADPERLWLMAELLYLEGLQAAASTAEAAGRLDLERALAIYARLPAHWKPAADLASAGDRAAEIQQLLTAD